MNWHQFYKEVADEGEKSLRRNKMHIGHLLFHTHGRISRKVWWLSNIAIWLCAILTTWIWHTYGFHDAIFGFAVSLLMFWFRTNINIKRLHDHGHSGITLLGWWILTEVPIIGWVIGIVIYGCLSGNEGANDHGADPVDPERF